MTEQEIRLSKPLNDRYINVVFQGSTFPDAPYKTVKVIIPPKILSEYLPAFDRAIPNSNKGLKLLLTVMAIQEGFSPGTRAYKYNNPGNIGNTDSGANKGFETLEDGIKAQRDHVQNIIYGKSKSYPMGKTVYIKPFYSKEIANNPQYGLPANLPGYQFVFNGQLSAFVKIYSTGARAGNSYLNRIVSYFKQNGIAITPESTIQDIVSMQ